MSFNIFGDDQKKVVKSNLNQVIDIIQEDVSGSATRRKYQTFVTGGIGPGVTSSLYQTIYDQDFTLQTANPVMDMTIGLFHNDNRPNLVTSATQTNYSISSSTDQLLFDSSTTMMMREKINIYRQYANYLLGDPNAAFILDPENYPSSANDTAFEPNTNRSVIDAALFVNVKRLFARDGIRKETFALRTYKNAPQWDTTTTPDSFVYFYDENGTIESSPTDPSGNEKSNILGDLVLSSEYGVQIIADLGAAQDHRDSTAGDVALLKLASDNTKIVGLLFYQAGIAVLNLGGSSLLSGINAGTGEILDTGLGQSATGVSIVPVYEPRDIMFGKIKGMSNDSDSAVSETAGAGEVLVGVGANTNGPDVATVRDTLNDGTGDSLGPATFYPDLLVSASIDDIIDHIGYTRFSSGSLTAAAFQNQTQINSSIYFCRATANQFNRSSNPTYLGDDGIPVMIQDVTNDKPFTYITTVVLADENSDIVAVAKLNRPIEKNDESEVSIRVRLDF